jgi:hypothetical protein
VISTAIRVARVGSAAELAAAVLMMLGYPALMLAALIPSVPAFAAAAVVTYVADHYLHRQASYLINRLSKVRAGLSIRFLIRQLLLILLLARMDLSDNLIFYGAIACFIAFYGLQAPHGAVVTLIRNRRRMPVATRNVDLGSRIRIPDAPKFGLLERSAEKMLHLDLFAVVGLLISAQLDAGLAGFIGIGITLFLGTLYVLALLPYIRGTPDPADSRGHPGGLRRLAARVQAADGAVLLRLQGLGVPGQHVAGDHGGAGHPAADRAARAGHTAEPRAHHRPRSSACLAACT